MKKITLLLIFFWSTSVGAAVYPVANVLDSLQKACYYQLRTDTAGTASMTDDMVEFALKRALARVCREFPALEKIDTVTVSSATEGAVLNSDFLRIRQVFKMIGNTRIPLDFKPREELFAAGATEKGYTHALGKPTSPRYCFTHGQRLLFHPKDAKASATPDSFLVLYYAMDEGMDTSGATTAIAPEYIDALLYAALAELSAMKKDYTAAQFYWQRFEAEKGNVQPREAELKQ